MKIIVTESNGQLKSKLKHLKSQELNWLFLSSQELDITNKNSFLVFFHSNKNDLVFNYAVYTNVDEADNSNMKSNLINESW